jgi:hypothetical protein
MPVEVTGELLSCTNGSCLQVHPAKILIKLIYNLCLCSLVVVSGFGVVCQICIVFDQISAVMLNVAVFHLFMLL